MKWSLARIIAILLVLIVAIFYFRRDWLEHSQDGPIKAAAARYSIEPALVKAIVWRESRFNPRVRGAAQEIGLMQIREDAAFEWADAEHLSNFDHEQCFDPKTNTMAGTWYLAKLLRRYSRTDNPVPYALADYNAGRGNVLKWNSGAAATNSMVFIEQIGFNGTRHYVSEVMARYDHYRSTFQ
jgi:soluble lytic murein transglycosylase